MQLKRITTVCDGRFLNVELPDNKGIILKGDPQVREHIYDIVRVLLSCDYSSVLTSGKSSNLLEKNSSIGFTSGSILSKDKAVTIEGVVPRLHCVEQAESGVRSFLISDGKKVDSVCTDLTKDVSALPADSWVRLISLVNKVVGFEFVKLTGDTLSFDYDMDYSKETLEVIYLLISESFLTPEGYLRLVLLKDSPYLDSRQLGTLMETLTNIRGIDVVLSIADMTLEDVSGNSGIAFVSI